MKFEKYLIVITGPTAVGKTDVTINLAKYFKTEILSADARQCYREMNIGTAKASIEQLNSVTHHFINSHSILDQVNAASYEILALKHLDEIFKKNQVALVCGGTGLYIQALLHGLDVMPEIPNTEVESIQSVYQKQGLDWLKAEVARKDPTFYANCDQNNPHRLMRALAFYNATGYSITKYQTKTKKKRDFVPILIGLEIDRDALYNRINKRVDIMVTEGLVEEALHLFEFKHLKALQTVGYKEFYNQDTFPTNPQEISKIIEKIKQHTRNYAKRQMTWFKNKMDCKWLSPSDLVGIINYIETEMKAK